MTKDTFQLLKYALIGVLLIAVWFGATSLSRNIVVESLLGWVGFAAVALYWLWLKRKIGRPKP
jgi:FtsH-binding integral membrane protein